MEYSIYVNQKAAIAWDLSMAESMMFGYLISSGGWMSSLTDSPEYKWASNSKLATELPLVCGHKGSARRHMKSLEEKQLIDRITVGNKSYFRITEKGNSWRSDTLIKANETVDPKVKGERNGSPKANETVDPKANETVDQSDKPSLSDIPISERKKREFPSADEERQIVNAYHEILPEFPRVSSVGWMDSETRENLHKVWAKDVRCRKVGFWVPFFETVREKEFWMTGRSGRPIEQARLSWLLTPSKYKSVITLALELEGVES